MNDRMKIAYILPYDWGGMPHYTAELTNAIAKYADVTIFGSKGIHTEYFSDTIRIERIFDPLEFSMNQLGGIFSLGSLKGLLSYKAIVAIDQLKPDIIHLPAPVIPPLAFFIKFYRLDKRYSIIYTKHCLHSQSGWLIYILEQWVLGSFEWLIKFKKIIVHTNHDKNDLVTSTKIEDTNIVVIPHGAYTFFNQCPDSKTFKGSNTIIFFGNIREYKGLIYLIRAVPLIEKQIPDLKVIIAGEGDLSPYQAQMKECNKSVFEIHNEFIPDDLVASLFQRSALAVLPYSEMSGMSGVLNVAYAFGKPVVVSDVGGLEEAVESGKTGLLVPSRDSQALADAVIRLLTDSDLRTEMEKNVHQKAEELSWDTIARKHLELYHSLVRT
jgi:glycosyltransferase involved in cell wall biosynthesis